MPRKEVYQLRLTKDEKDELARRAREQGISIAKLMRQKLKLDASGESFESREDFHDSLKESNPMAYSLAKEFDARVNELARTMPRSNAERLARKEMS